MADYEDLYVGARVECEVDNPVDGAAIDEFLGLFAAKVGGVSR